MWRFPLWLLCGSAFLEAGHAQFIPTAAGPYFYLDNANWTGGQINDFFSQTLTANQSVVLSSAINAAPIFTFGGGFDLALRGNSAVATRLSLTGNLVVDSVAGGRTVSIGSATALNEVEVVTAGLGLNVASDDTLVLWNRVSGTGFYTSGPGTVILRGSNTYTGGTGIGAGILDLSADNNLGALPATPANNITFAGDPFAPGILRLAASFDINANRSITFAASSFGTIDTNGFNSTYAGTISGVGNAYFEKRGAGELRLKGANTYFGDTFIRGGTLAWDYTANNAGKLNATGYVTLSGRGALSLIGSNSATTVQGISSLTISGNNAIRLSNGVGQSVSFNVDRLLRDNGTVDLTRPASGGIHVNTPVTVGVLGYATVSGVDWAARDASGYLVPLSAYDTNSLAAGANSDLTADQSIATSTAISSLRFNTAAPVTVSINAAARLTIGAPGQVGGILVTASAGNNPTTIVGGQLTADTRDLAVFQNNTAQPLTISSAIVNGAAAIGLTKSGPGVLVLSGANTFTRGTFVADGILRLGGGGQLPAGQPVSLLENTTLDLGGISQAIGALSGSAGSVVTLGGATLTFGGDNMSAQFDGIISGPGGLRKTGTGPSYETLTAPNTYTGPTLIDGGFITLSGNGSLPSSTTLNIATGTQAGLQLNGRSQTVANLTSPSPKARILGPGTFTIGSGDGTYAGDFLGALSLVKDGAGTTTVLSGASSHTGGTTFKAGTLAITNDLALGAAPLSAMTANLTFAGGALQLRADIPTLDQNRGIFIKSAPAIIDTNGFSTAIPGTVSGSGGVTKIGEGVLSIGTDFSAANTFSGGVTVNGGTLLAATNGALGAGSNVVRLNEGSLSATGVIPRSIILGANGGGLGTNTEATYSGIVSGLGPLTVNTLGSVTLTAQNTYVGGTQIGPIGALLVTGSNRSLGTGPVTVLSGGLLGLSAVTNLAPGYLVALRPGAAFGALNTSFDPAAIIDSDPAKTTGGILALSVTTYDRPLNMAAIGNGRFFLSAFGSATYTAPALGAGVDGIYRLGASSATGTNILKIGGTDNILTGASPVVVGSVDAAANATVALLNANNFTGGTTLAAGTLALGNDHALGSGLLTIAGGALSASSTVTLENPVLATGDFSFGPSVVSLILNGPLDLGGGTRQITIAAASQFSAGMRINGRISNGALYKGGAGGLVLASANDYAGGTTILGTLSSLTQGALGTGPITLGSTLIISGTPQTLANPIAITGIGAPASLVFNTATNVTGNIASTTTLASSLGLSGTSNEAIISGVIGDSGGTLSLGKRDVGTVTLAGLNSYRGTTTFGRGTIVATTDANLGAGGGLVFNGGTLRYGAAFALNATRSVTVQTSLTDAPTIDTNGFDVTIANAFANPSGLGRFEKTGAGRLTLTGTNLFVSPLLTGGTLQFNSIGAMGIGTLSMSAGSVVAAGFAMNQTFLNKLQKSSTAVVALAADSSNTLDFTGANWRLGATGAFAFSGTLTPNGTTYRLGGGGGTLTVSAANALSGARSVDIDHTAAPAGAVILSNSNSYSGATTINGGTLKLGSLGNIPNTSAITLTNGATFDVSSRAIGFTLASGKTLSGAGRVLGRLTIATGATVSPGTAAARFGELALENFTLQGRYLADVDATGHHDSLLINGNLDLSSTTDALSVNVIDFLGGEYVLASYTGTLTGSFDSIMLPPGTAIDYGTRSNSQIRIVPEPTVAMLIFAGGFAFSRRGRRS